MRSRGWCYTINHPSLSDELDISTLNDQAKYNVVGLEHGDTGNEHYQGYCYFKTLTSFKRIKELLPRAHIEKQRGSCSEAINYCKKEGQFTEYGDMPDGGGGSTQRAKWGRILELSELGDYDTIKSEFPGEYVRYEQKLRSLRVRPTVIIDGDLENEWWYGDTGLGKSKKLWELYPDHFTKEKNKWWDGYRDEEIIGIEEWEPAHSITAGQLKIWADRYPFTGQIKGGTIRKLRPKKIIVTSNYSIEECFPNPKDHLPLKRRFKCIRFESFFN